MKMVGRAAVGIALVGALLFAAMFVRPEGVVTTAPSVQTLPAKGAPKPVRPARQVPSQESDAIGKIKIQP
jgi:hypothetical protein